MTREALTDLRCPPYAFTEKNRSWRLRCGAEAAPIDRRRRNVLYCDSLLWPVVKIRSTQMRAATLRDLHGNLRALEAVLGVIPAEATIVVGGDICTGVACSPPALTG